MFWLYVIAFEVFLTITFVVLPGEMFVALVQVLACAVMLIKPAWGIYLLVFSVPLLGGQLGLINSDYEWARNQIIPVFSFVTLAGLFFVLLLKTVKENREDMLAVPLVLPISAMLVYAALTLYFCPNREFSVIVFLILFMNILLYYYITFLITDFSVHKACMVIFLIAGLVGVAFTVYSIIYHPRYTVTHDLWDPFQLKFLWDPKVRLRGYAFEQPNFTALMLNLASSVAIGFMLVARQVLKKYLLANLYLLLLFAICLTSSKGALGAHIVMVLFIIFFNSRLSLVRIVMPSVVFLAILILVWIATIEFVSIFDEPRHMNFTESDFSLETRLTMWKEGLNALLEDKKGFLVGLGIGGFSYSTQNLWAHNLLFSFYFDFGIFGVIFLGSIFWVIFRMLYYLRRFFFAQQTYYQKMSLALCGGLVAISVHSLVDFQYNLSILWLFLAFLLATLRLALTESDVGNERSAGLYGFSVPEVVQYRQDAQPI